MKSISVRRGALSWGSSLILAVCALGPWASPSSVQDTVNTEGDVLNTENDIRRTRDALSQWVEVQQTLSREREDWRLDEAMLQERIDLLQDRIDHARSEASAVRAKIETTDVDLAQAQNKYDELEAALATLEPVLLDLEARTRALVRRLPDPLLDKIDLLIQRLPTSPDESEAGSTVQLSMTERFQSVVGILNEANKFNRGIQPVSELRNLGAETSAQVRTLYIGLSVAYFATPNGEAAGVGKPTDGGWVWTLANEHAAEIARAIEIYESAQEAAFVRLPLTID